MNVAHLIFPYGNDFQLMKPKPECYRKVTGLPKSVSGLYRLNKKEKLCYTLSKYPRKFNLSATKFQVIRQAEGMSVPIQFKRMLQNLKPFLLSSY